jgi:UDP-N-acetylglucosamine 2-epimerase (non-hydrolysing)/GDP/UDP-N,N'-diacetylbacillosamine 2-epimerase (hydrolysing)
MDKHKICFITSARSEYGLLKWIMKDVEISEELQLQLVVTGAHLLQEQGHTIDSIKNDGFYIDKIVDAALDLSTKTSIAVSMGRLMQKVAKTFEELSPDMIVVLGDRYELLPICQAAYIMEIPIAHISGGDVTEGAIDDGIRNSVTMLATYHFPGTKQSLKNIVRMRGSECNAWAVGEPGLDAFRRVKLLSRVEIADSLGLNLNKKWGLVTYHSETKISREENLKAVNNILDVLSTLNDYEFVMTYANADFPGREINEILEEKAQKDERFKVVPSLGQLRYLSFMKQVSFVIGNSSSGIVEAPNLKIPVVNVGNREKGRYQCQNIYQSSNSKQDLLETVEKAMRFDGKVDDSMFWGDGHTSERIVEKLEKIWKK